jgi:hypothetical protein
MAAIRKRSTCRNFFDLLEHENSLRIPKYQILDKSETLNSMRKCNDPTIAFARGVVM